MTTYNPYTTLASEYGNELERDICKNALEILSTTYPGYSWKVFVKDGICFIKLLDSRLKGQWGMNVKLRAVDHDAAVFKREVKFMAGEFLERCGVSRTGSIEELIRKVDGIPAKYQPGPVQ